MKVKICNICLGEDLDYVKEGLEKIDGIELEIGCHNLCALKKQNKLFAIVEGNPFPFTSQNKEDLINQIISFINK